jgi:2-dehydro-3-deoxy-D-arabinonate dehydratase
MHLFKTKKGNILQQNSEWFLLAEEWDQLINQKSLFSHLAQQAKKAERLTPDQAEEFISKELLPPIGNQEVWAAGVTYLKSRDARMEESEDSGAADCYSRVYEAARPELFFKSLPHRVVGHNQQVNIRKDSSWNVPEPELALFINSAGKIQAYTIGNDMSSRSIEGENPLYLPQAKMYDKSAALGPCLYIIDSQISPSTVIHINIYRNGQKMFDDSTTLSRMKRSLNELADYLFREMDFEKGCFLMTGTCVVPPAHFTLQERDEINITIDGIGTMTNRVGIKS